MGKMGKLIPIITLSAALSFANCNDTKIETKIETKTEQYKGEKKVEIADTITTPENSFYANIKKEGNYNLNFEKDIVPYLPQSTLEYMTSLGIEINKIGNIKVKVEDLGLLYGGTTEKNGTIVMNISDEVFSEYKKLGDYTNDLIFLSIFVNEIGNYIIQKHNINHAKKELFSDAFSLSVINGPDYDRICFNTLITLFNSNYKIATTDVETDILENHIETMATFNEVIPQNEFKQLLEDYFAYVCDDYVTTSGNNQFMSSDKNDNTIYTYDPNSYTNSEKAGILAQFIQTDTDGVLDICYEITPDIVRRMKKYKDPFTKNVQEKGEQLYKTK